MTKIALYPLDSGSISKKRFVPGIFGQARRACACPIKSFRCVTSYRSSPPHLSSRSSFSNFCVLVRLVVPLPNMLRPVLCFPSGRANSWLKSDALRPLTPCSRTQTYLFFLAEVCHALNYHIHFDNYQVQNLTHIKRPT